MTGGVEHFYRLGSLLYVFFWKKKKTGTCSKKNETCRQAKCNKSDTKVLFDSLVWDIENISMCRQKIERWLLTAWGRGKHGGLNVHSISVRWGWKSSCWGEWGRSMEKPCLWCYQWVPNPVLRLALIHRPCCLSLVYSLCVNITGCRCDSVRLLALDAQSPGSESQYSENQVQLHKRRHRQEGQKFEVILTHVVIWGDKRDSV